jgi:hypothetical protein
LTHVSFFGFNGGMRVLWLLASIGCGSGSSSLERDDPAAAPDLDNYRAMFETWRVARAGAVVAGEVRVVIDGGLDPERVVVTGTGPAGIATRRGDDWHIEVDGEAPRLGRGVPLEVLLLRLARAGAHRWRGPVLLPGIGFAPAVASVEPDGERTIRVQLSGPAGILSMEVDLAADRTVARAIGPDLSVHRVDRPPAPGGAPPDLVALGAIEVAGDPSNLIELAVDRSPPPHIRRSASGWLATLGDPPAAAPPVVPDPPVPAGIRRLADSMAAASPRQELRRLARASADLLADDLASGADASAARALARGRADCVGHAALFSALARARGHDVRLVTGYRLDGRRLVRHAWAVAAGVAIDPTIGDLALPGRYLPLAVHGSAAAEVALAAELAYAGLTGARARFSAPRSARSTPRTP